MELPPDFTLRSGLGGVAPQEEQGIAVSLCAFMRLVVEDAAAYAAAAGRRGAHPRDCLLAMKSLAVGHFWRREGLAEAFAWASEVVQEGEEGEEEEEEEEEVIDEEWCPATEGELAARLNAAEAEFEAWVPQTPLERAVAGAVRAAATAATRAESR